jgi:GH24 family phage-related lysozyme (muramidase)
MNLEELKEDIAKEEGLKYEIYRCSEGYPTAGIGHLITEWDEEYYGMPIGTEVSKEQVDKWFEADLYVAINDMEKFTADMQVDENVKECITHMVFQLGLPRLNKFKNFKQALIDGDIAKAQAEMKDSLWYRQTTNRAERLIEKMGKSL